MINLIFYYMQQLFKNIFIKINKGSHHDEKLSKTRRHRKELPDNHGSRTYHF